MDEIGKKKILVSGIQPSGQLHIGNYFGAIKQIVDLINKAEYEAYVFLADYHSMTTLQDPKKRLQNTLEITATYLACGLDKNKIHIFKQSDIKGLTELTWILDTVTPVPMLFLAHAFKDKVGEDKLNLENLKNINVGLFNYPVLMASDILIYGADIVPVGSDQEQHIEYTRELAKKYNFAYKSTTLTFPKSHINKEVATVLGIDGTKMSKSKNNHICMFGEKEEIKKKIMSIKTDSLMPNEIKNPDENNIYNIHKLFLSKEDNIKLRKKFLESNNNPYSYKEAKDELYETMLSYFEGMRVRYEYFTNTNEGKKEIMEVLNTGAKAANKKAEEMMSKIRKETGLDF